jgi:hypothetical protein
MLRRMGFPELAEEALRVLPDPVDLDFAAEELTDRMGGSPGRPGSGRQFRTGAAASTNSSAPISRTSPSQTGGVGPTGELLRLRARM